MKCAIGQDSHAFDRSQNNPLILGGIVIPHHASLKANSDGDVVLHALTNAISGITGVNILGKIADDLCKEKGITDSKRYVEEALKHLKNHQIHHVSFSIECFTPKLSAHMDTMKSSIAKILDIDESNVGITATSGEGLTSFGQGLGIQCFCVVTVL